MRRVVSTDKKRLEPLFGNYAPSFIFLAHPIPFLTNHNSNITAGQMPGRFFVRGIGFGSCPDASGRRAVATGCTAGKTGASGVLLPGLAHDLGQMWSVRRRWALIGVPLVVSGTTQAPLIANIYATDSKTAAVSGCRRFGSEV